MSSPLVMALETSCDETAAAVVEAGRIIRSSVVATQSDRHAPYGGVVPEIAGRAHVEMINDVLEQTQVESGCTLDSLDAVAAAHGPGLAGALLVGVSAAKALALAGRVPYVGVNHHEAHMYAAMIEEPALEPPFVTLVVSGGHTLLVLMRDHGRYELLGQTVDDAAGEAFDKVARFLGLGYPGGPILDRLAREGDPDAVDLPRPMIGDGLDFSFSGLKTAVITHCRADPGTSEADVAAAFQAAVVDVLAAKLFRAADQCGIDTVVIGGGVAANSLLRSVVLDEAEQRGRRAVVPSVGLCTDNAAMVAAAATWQLERTGPTDLSGGAYPRLRLGSEG